MTALQKKLFFKDVRAKLNELAILMRDDVEYVVTDKEVVGGKLLVSKQDVQDWIESIDESNDQDLDWKVIMGWANEIWQQVWSNE